MRRQCARIVAHSAPIQMASEDRPKGAIKRMQTTSPGGADVAKISVEDFNQLLKLEMPWALEAGLLLDALGPGTAKMRLPYDAGMLRPGGTVSGPTMMMLADALMYAVVLSAVGKVPLAVTTNFSINFLNRPRPADLIAEGRALKIGRRLAVVEVSIYSDGVDDPVAHATGTYSIPPNR